MAAVNLSDIAAAVVSGVVDSVVVVGILKQRMNGTLFHKAKVDNAVAAGVVVVALQKPEILFQGIAKHADILGSFEKI